MFVDFNILNQLGSPSINSNTFANRPSAGQVGRLFVSTDTFEIYRDTGTGWDLIGGPGSSTVTGSGAAGQVTYWTGTNSVGGENNLWWDAASNHLGINTITPGASLDIHSAADVGMQLNGTGATPNIYIDFLQTGTSQYRLGYTDGTVDYQRFSIYDVTGAKEVLTVDKQSRYVGINYQYSSLSDQPAYTLDVSGSLRITDSVYLATAANNRVGIGTTSPQYPFDVVVPNTTAIAIVTTRENANGPSYFVGRCIGGTYASPTDQATFGAILQSFGYRSGAYKEQGYLSFAGVNATTGNGIFGYWQLFLTNDSSVITQIAQASADSFNIGGDYLQTTYKLKVTGQSSFSAGLGQLGAFVNNTTSAASGVTGYGLLISSEASASTSYALHLINSAGSVSYGGVSTATGQVGYWSIGFAATGTIGNRLTVSGAFSVGSGSYLTTAAPSNGAMIQGNTLIGTTTDNGQKLQVSGDINASTSLSVGNLAAQSSYQLQLVGNAFAGFYRDVTSGDRGYFIDIGARGTSNNLITGAQILGVVETSNTNGYLSFYTLDTTLQERVRIISTGQMGIGVAAPVEKLEVNGAIKTAAPTTGTAAAWKLGQRVAAAVVLDATQYIEVEVGGTFYKLAIVT